MVVPVLSIGTADQTNFRDSVAHSGGRGANSSGQAAGSGAEAVQVHGQYANTLAGHAQRADQSQNVRDAGRRLDLAGYALEQAEDKLLGIVKHYPPYAKDHPERIDLLNQISGLRKQIEALSVPPKKDSPALVGLPGFDELDPYAASDMEVAATLGQVKNARFGLLDRHAGLWADIVDKAAEQSEQNAVISARQGMVHLAQSAKSITLSQDVIASLG